MFFLLSFLSLISFIIYFYSLGVWYFALFPILFLIGFVGYFAFKTPISFSSTKLIRYSLYFSRSFILASIFGLLSFFNVTFPISFLILLVGNAVLWIVSYFISYSDGKKLFQYGYYLVLIVFFLAGLFILPSNQIFSFLIILLSFHFGFMGFFVFIIGIWLDLERDFLYTLVISGLFIVCLLIVFRIPSFAGALSLISILLTGLYLGLRWFVQKKPVERGHISVRRILAGERVTAKAFFSHKFLSTMYNFVIDMPLSFRYFLELLNVCVVVSLFVSFSINWSQIGTLNQLFYWIVISFFVGNVLLLKRIGYTSVFQNFFLFLVIHFAMYISFFSYFEGNIQSVVFWAILWNLTTSLLLFVLPDRFQHMFTHKDYRYWIVVSILSFFINTILLLKTSLAGELIFFLLLLYVGLEAMIVFYGIRHTSNKFVD